MDYIEEIEDRLTFIRRKDEPTIPQLEVEERFREKFGES